MLDLLIVSWLFGECMSYVMFDSKGKFCICDLKMLVGDVECRKLIN